MFGYFVVTTLPTADIIIITVEQVNQDDVLIPAVIRLTPEVDY